MDDGSLVTLVVSGWEHPFCLVLVVKLGPGWLELHLQVANTGRQAFAFTGAVHTYFAVDDVRQLGGGCSAFPSFRRRPRRLEVSAKPNPSIACREPNPSIACREPNPGIACRELGFVPHRQPTKANRPAD